MRNDFEIIRQDLAHDDTRSHTETGFHSLSLSLEHPFFEKK